MSAAKTKTKPQSETPDEVGNAKVDPQARADFLGIPVQDESGNEMESIKLGTAEPVTSDAEPIIDLDDIAPERGTIKYRGDLYELATLSEFGIRKQQQLTRDGREFSNLWTSDVELTDDQAARMEMLLNRMLEDVLIASDAIKASLNDAQKSQVVLSFTLAPLVQRAAREQKEEAARVSESTTAS